MKLNNLFILRSIVALGYALTLLVIPGTMLTLYGISPDQGTILMTRFLAVELIFAGLLCWQARKIADAAFVRSILISLLVAEAVGVVVAIYGTLSGVFTPLGWTIVLIYSFFSIGYVYFLFFKKSIPA